MFVGQALYLTLWGIRLCFSIICFRDYKYWYKKGIGVKETTEYMTSLY